MKTKYRVKLNDLEKHIGLNNFADLDQVKDGYLAFHGVIQEYDKVEAAKKAKWFEGKIEKVEEV